MLDDSARVGQGPPSAVTTDGSLAEWQGAFKEKLAERGIVHRVKQKEDRNAMGKLDASMQQLRAQLMRPAVEIMGPWSARLPEVVRVYNNLLGHEGSFGSPPVDVIGENPREMSEDNVLDFQVMRKMARGLKQNSEQNQRNRDKVMGEGAFRHALPFWRDAVKAGRNVRFKYSEKAHQVDGEDGPYVKDTEGKLYNPKLVRPVPPGSKSVEVPPELQAVGLEERTFSRKKMWPSRGRSTSGCRSRTLPWRTLRSTRNFATLPG